MLDAKTSAPVLDIDPFAEAVLRNPAQSHLAMREAGAVFRLAAHDCWGVARYDEARTILQNHEVFISSAGVGLTNVALSGGFRKPSLLIEADPPDHTRNRAIVTSVLSPKAIRELQTELEGEAGKLLGELVGIGEFDAVSRLSEAYPLKVFADAVGLPEGGRRTLLDYGSMTFNSLGTRIGTPNAIYQASAKDAERIVAWIMDHCSRERLSPGGFGARIYAEAARRGLPEGQAQLMVRSFLSAGIDTTVHAISNAILCFAKYPEQWAKLRSDPKLARKAIDEVLRFESPFQHFFRTTGRDTELAGVSIPAGQKIFISLAAANRDPRQWSNPEDFEIERFPSGHLGFGLGIHGCVGQMIARLEMEVLLLEMARKVERIELAGTPVSFVNNSLHGVSALPVRFIAG